MLTETPVENEIQQMDIRIPFFEEISLRIGPVFLNGEDYPSSQLQKGLILVSNGQELAEEGVGFGVPVLMKGLKTIFAGEMELGLSNEGLRQEITATYLMNLQERLVSGSSATIKSVALYRVKNQLEEVHRRYPLLRAPLISLSNWWRNVIGWRTVYEDAGCKHLIKVNYSVDLESRTVAVRMNTAREAMDGVNEIILMNEQGANYFDVYTDSSGLHLEGDEIGTWERVSSMRARFISKGQRLAFSLGQMDGATLFRGRELVASHLAWAGFGYSLPASRQEFAYTLGIERLE